MVCDREHRSKWHILKFYRVPTRFVMQARHSWLPRKARESQICYPFTFAPQKNAAQTLRYGTSLHRSFDLSHICADTQ